MSGLFLNYLATLFIKINMFQYVMHEWALKKGKMSLFKSHKGLLLTSSTKNSMNFVSRAYSNRIFDLMPIFRPPLTYSNSFYHWMGIDLRGTLICLIPLFWLGSIFCRNAEKCNFPLKMNFLKMTVKNIQIHGIMSDYCKRNKKELETCISKLNFQIFYSSFTLI